MIVESESEREKKETYKQQWAGRVNRIHVSTQVQKPFIGKSALLVWQEKHPKMKTYTVKRQKT